MPRCAIILLAAGASTRLGSAKQLVEINGVPLLVHAAQTALATAARPVVVVLGANARRFEPLVAGLGVDVVFNEDWARGMGTSIRAGMGRLQDASLDAVMILLCDQPYIKPEHLNAMIEAFSVSGKSIAAAHYNGVLGTPAIFDAMHFEALRNLGDAQGGKALFGSMAEKILAFDLPEAAVDLDTPEDLGRLFRP
jgi:molybdenum cofactor cytidylyltransferase